MPVEKIDLPESCAMIKISRCSGRVELYGAPFTLENFIEIKIQGAEESRDITGTRRKANSKNYIRFWMSSNQFAQAITTLNTSPGTPCTVRGLGEKEYAEFKFDQQQVAEKIEFQQEGLKHLKAAIESLDRAIEAAKQIKVKKERDSILAELESSRLELRDRLPFVSKMFVEYLDNIEQQIKTELAAYFDLTVKDLGLETLTKQQAQTDKLLPEILDLLYSPEENL